MDHKTKILINSNIKNKKMILLNFLSKVKKKSSEKLRGKKREIATTLALVATLLFGAFRSRHVKDQYQYYPISEKLAHKKVISDQELNSLDDFHNSGQMIQTGNGTILRFQQEVSDASSNKILFEHNLNEPNEVILVKYDGILPGADGYPLNNNPRRHPPGRPRMRGSKPIKVFPPQNIQGLGNIPEGPKIRSFKEVDTGLNARRGNRDDQCPAAKLDMKSEYENFMQEISKKGYELECSQERFNELSTNTQTGSFDEKSLIEAKGGLQGEAQGMYTNIRRPSNKAVDLDFEIDSSKGYTH